MKSIIMVLFFTKLEDKRMEFAYIVVLVIYAH